MQITTEGAEGHWLSTGEAARLCSVTPDAVQKWIRKGRISAQRTAGGHYRIALGDIAGLMTTPGRSQWFAAPPPHCAPRPLRCWECLGNAGEVPEDCKRCVVYRVRASWCFEVLGDARAAEDARAFCHTQGSCSGCSYFKMVYRLPKNILVVTADPGLIRELTESSGGGMQIRHARNGYEASTLVGVFQPGCVIFDQDTAGVAEPAVLDCLLRDGRVPGQKVILCGSLENRTTLPQSQRIAGWLQKPFDRAAIAALIGSLPVECRSPLPVTEATP